ncbi:hypothetical protein D3C87_1109540 [compost metagenome]
MVAPMGTAPETREHHRALRRICARSPIPDRHCLGAHLDRYLRAVWCVLDRVLHEVLQHREKRTPIGAPVHRLALKLY